MLDFFRDIALEIVGIDSEKVRQDSRNKKENRKKYIFSNGAKTTIYLMGITYLITGGLSVWSVRGKGQIPDMVKFVFLFVIDIAALICLSVKNKKAEIISLILIVIFIIIMYSTTMIFI